MVVWLYYMIKCINVTCNSSGNTILKLIKNIHLCVIHQVILHVCIPELLKGMTNSTTDHGHKPTNCRSSFFMVIGLLDR